MSCLALPKGKDSPSSVLEFGLIAFVSPDIVSSFRSPKLGSRTRNDGPKATFVAVPKTTMNKYHRMVAWKDDVRLAGEVLPM